MIWFASCARGLIPFVRFGFGYNMPAKVTVSALQHVPWTYFSLLNYHYGLVVFANSLRWDTIDPLFVWSFCIEFIDVLPSSSNISAPTR